MVGSQPFLQCVAVSTTSDATGSYARYSFQYANSRIIQSSACGRTRTTSASTSSGARSWAAWRARTIALPCSRARLPPDLLRANLELRESPLSNLNHWGDYSAMTIDPVDDCTFWFTSEYLKANGTFNWSTQITSFKVAGCQ